MTKDVTTTEESVQPEPKAGRLYLLSALSQEESALEQLNSIVREHQGKVEKSENLGSRNLTYPINKHNSLLLLSVFFTSSPDKIKAIEADLGRDEAIERFLLTDWRGDINAPRRSDRYRDDRSKSQPREEKADKESIKEKEEAK